VNQRETIELVGGNMRLSWRHLAVAPTIAGLVSVALVYAFEQLPVRKHQKRRHHSIRVRVAVLR
jgi:hypothetical protein